MDRVGIIDIGSNTIHLLIVDIVNKDQIIPITKEKYHLLLGENLNTDSNISESKLNDTIQVLKKYLSCCIKNNIKSLIVVATEALRKAQNSSFIIDSIENKLGIKIKILSPKEEAFLEFLGVTKNLSISNGIIMDTGGNSTELILVKGGNFENFISLPYGSINVCEKIKFNDLGNYLECIYTLNYFDKIFNSIPWLKNANNYPLIGIGGSFKNIRKIYNYKYSTSNIEDVSTLSFEEFSYIHNLLKGSSYHDRENIVGLSKKRRDNILGGCEIISSYLKYTKNSVIQICDSGLRSGVLQNYINSNFKK